MSNDVAETVDDLLEVPVHDTERVMDADRDREVEPDNVAVEVAVEEPVNDADRLIDEVRLRLRVLDCVAESELLTESVRESLRVADSLVLSVVLGVGETLSEVV